MTAITSQTETTDHNSDARAAVRGLKHLCASCGMRYYDLHKNPAACPSCKHVNVSLKPPARRGRRSVVSSTADERNALSADMAVVAQPKIKKHVKWR